MDPELKKKIDTYANNAFAAASKRISDMAKTAREEKMAEMAKRGLAYSSVARRDLLEVEAQRIRSSVLAKAEGLIGGYELNGVPLNDEIVTEVSGYYGTAISAAANAMKGQVVMDVHRTGSNPATAEHFVNGIKQNLQIMTHGIINEVVCLVEERKIMPKFKKEQPAQNIIFTAHGHNARVNLNNSTDNSVNTVTEQNVFSEIRDVIKADVPASEQEDLLQRLSDLEDAIQKPTAMERYRNFVARAADYATLLPFIPKLLEMAKHLAQAAI